MTISPNIRQQLLTAVRRARAMADQRLKDAPDYAVMQSAAKQLLYINTVAASDNVPTTAEADRLTLGVLAAREFENSDPEFAAIVFQVLELLEQLMTDA